MNSSNFLELSKRNIFHSFMKCNKESDPKYIPNYAPLVIVEFNDSEFVVKEFNTKKKLFSSKYEKINSIHLSVCTRLMSIRFAPSKMFDIEYIINTDEEQLHFESKNPLIWKSILSILRNHEVKIDDPLLVEENIKNCNEAGDFYKFCSNNIDEWKKRFHILDPKVGDLITR